MENFDFLNKYTIDDVGNIGESYHVKSRFNKKDIGSNITMDDIFNNSLNKNYFINNYTYLDKYVIGNNVLRFYGQKVPSYPY